MSFPVSDRSTAENTLQWSLLSEAEQAELKELKTYVKSLDNAIKKRASQVIDYLNQKAGEKDQQPN